MALIAEYLCNFAAFAQKKPTTTRLYKWVPRENRPLRLPGRL